MRAAAMAGIAKAVYDQARKPENQARIRAAVAKARSSRQGTTRTVPTRARTTRHPR